MVVCIDYCDSQPVLGVIKFICSWQNTLLFIYNELTIVFRDHEYAYEVLETSNIINVIRYDKLLYSKPMCFTTKGVKKFVLIRSYF